MENSGTFDAVLEHDLRFLITVLRLCSALPQLRSVGINLLRLASISWARPKIIEHGLSLGSFCWARSQIWHQLILSVASGGLRGASVEVSWHQFFEVGINFLSTTNNYWARCQFGLILLSTVSNLASVDPQRCLRWSPHCLSWGQLTSIFWAQPNLAEHGLILASGWHQLSLSIASCGLRIASTALSDINFLSTIRFGWAESHFGLRLASALPQVVSALPQLLWVTSIC